MICAEGSCDSPDVVAIVDGEPYCVEHVGDAVMLAGEVFANAVAARVRLRSFVALPRLVLDTEPAT